MVTPSDNGTLVQQRNATESTPKRQNSTAYTKIKAMKAQRESVRWNLLALGITFVLSAGLLAYIYLKFLPNLSDEERTHIKVPRDMDDAKALGVVLSNYTDEHYRHVVTGFFLTYIFLQSFAIPGSIFLSILSGYLFPFHYAIVLVCLCSALGASFCYLLSYLVGRRLVLRYIPDRVTQWQEKVARHRQHLLNYIIFLRITPFLPNWFINITSPVINVPLFPFFMGTFLGVAPPSFVAIQAGTTLHELTSSRDALSIRSVVLLTVFATLSLVPVIFRRKLQAKMD
ncbi:PREDICTED: transmembrane protein 41B-like isoform X2 [Priapulus caudatus]|uniref:Transmembrane protein 41B-like isoform X2 n=1 Tax=Priapulus caudatus TaxID=37621 RepID=A0ABM1E8J7_PRICU|nr:PREDICTED: transmembrane protein 41B-like isoform X2 [Priapulus caudatus]